MTHGRGKSDSAIVAGKPTNKAGQSVAEPVERRAEAKGNAGQHSTRRAQDRESVSHALGRIRRAARQRRQTPEVGAVCGKSARTDLCGGRPVMDVPTAIHNSARVDAMLALCDSGRNACGHRTEGGSALSSYPPARGRRRHERRPQ